MGTQGSMSCSALPGHHTMLVLAPGERGTIRQWLQSIIGLASPRRRATSRRSWTSCSPTPHGLRRNCWIALVSCARRPRRPTSRGIAKGLSGSRNGLSTPRPSVWRMPESQSLSATRASSSTSSRASGSGTSLTRCAIRVRRGGLSGEHARHHRKRRGEARSTLLGAGSLGGFRPLSGPLGPSARLFSVTSGAGGTPLTPPSRPTASPSHPQRRGSGVSPATQKRPSCLSLATTAASLARSSSPVARRRRNLRSGWRAARFAAAA